MVVCTDNNLNLSEDQINQLLNMASQRLGTDPQQLKNQLMSGSLDGLGGEGGSQLNQLLSNPQAMEKLMSSSKIKTMLGALLGRGNP